MGEICSHNQLFMAKHQFRKHLCKIQPEKRPKKWTSFFHKNLKYSQFEHIFTDCTSRGFAGNSPNTSKASAIHDKHFEVGLNL